MSKKIIIKNRNHGCLWLIGVALIACAAVYALAVAAVAAFGVLVWFAIRGAWRALAEHRPDSGVVRSGMRLSPTTRKVLAGIASFLIVFALVATMSAISPKKKSAGGGGAQQPAQEVKEKGGHAAPSKASGAVSTTGASCQAMLDGFLNRFNAASASPFVQDATFDPSDADSPYRPRRYNSPVYRGGKGAHGTCGDFSVTVIATSEWLEVGGTRQVPDYQSVADIMRSAIVCEYPDADRSAVDNELSDFVGKETHTLSLSDSRLLGSYADGDEFFLRLTHIE